MKRPGATSRRFEALVARAARELVESIGREAARRRPERAADEGGPALDIDAAEAESLVNGFLFPAFGDADPQAWRVFEERDASAGLFAWRVDLGGGSDADFIGACCRCFLGRDAAPDEVEPIATRLAARQLRRSDLVRTLMGAVDARAPGRFVVIPAPNPLAERVAPEGAGASPLLRIGA